MNGLIKVVAAVVVVMALIAGTVLWLAQRGGKNEESGQQQPAAIVEREIPKPLEQIALEEYAIEFEGGPQLVADLELCNIVKDQCRVQGIKNCEDYEMCMAGISK